MNSKKKLAVIPARGGSKGLPGKNIKILSGKPLIAYTIETAINSNVFDKIIVSTDDPNIAEISKRFGVEVPFLRPEYLATDTATSMDVIIHAVNWLEDNNEKFEYVMKLQPTSPLRTAEDIINSFELLEKKNADSIISVSKCEDHPLWTNTLDDTLSMEDFVNEEIKDKNRQELEDYYKLNGVIFLSKTKKLLSTKDWYGDNSYAYIMESVRSIDIDNIIDFKLAEILIKECKY